MSFARPSHFDAASLRRDLSDVASACQIAAHALTETACATCTGNSITCTWCGGDGVVHVDVTSYLRADVLWTVPGAVIYGPQGAMSPGDVGDLQFSTALFNQPVIERIKNDLGYLDIDGQRVKPFAFAPHRIGKETTLYVRANIVGAPVTSRT